MSYIGLAAAIGGFILRAWVNWGESLGDSAAIVLMFITTVYFILCSISIGLRNKFRTRFIQYIAGLAVQIEFGYLVLFLGLVSLGISLMQYGYLLGILAGVLIILAAYGVLTWGVWRQPVTIRRGSTNSIS